MLAGDMTNQIATINPEFILAARHDEELFYILNKVNLAIPDGIGLKFAALARGRIIHRLTGADLIEFLLKIAERQNKKIAIINWQNGLSTKEDIAETLKNKYPKLVFQVINCMRAENLSEELVDRLNIFSPAILFCALGSPWQEKIIFYSLAKLSSVKIGLGIGGGFDFLTGRIKRAPKIFRALGLEWLWRLIKQPWRAKRIYHATIVFPYQFFLWQFITRFFYRKNVACLLFKKENNKTKILLLLRADSNSHWQLPQGGIDRESLESAGCRELKEEIGTDKFVPVATFKNVHKYIWGDKLSKFGPLATQIWGYKGQKQGLFIGEFKGSDEDIKINFWEFQNWKWVDMENFVDEIHDVRREGAQKFLSKFKETINSKS